MLSVLPHAGGNVPATLPILAELAARGDAVIVLGHEQVRATVERGGMEFVAFQHARRWSASVDRPGMRSLAGYLTMASDRGSGRDVLRIAESFHPDVILLDCMVPGAMRSAKATGASVVMVMHTLYSYWDVQWSPHSPMGLWLRLTGTLPTSASRLPDAALLTTMPELDPLPERTRLRRGLIVQTGPTVASTPTGAAGDDASVLISLSTISYPGQEQVLQRLVDAVADLPVRAVVSTGPSLDPAAIAAPASVTVKQYLDHDEIMRTARLVVGHGGHGTSMRALSHGIPLLVVPMSSVADHYLVADAVVAAGAGGTVSKRASTEELRSVIARMLQDPAPRRGAQRLAALLAGRDGAAAAVTAIDDVLNRA